MNFYGLLLRQRAVAAQPQGSGAPAGAVHVFSSFFWSRLACGHGGYDFEGVRRWTKTLVRLRPPTPAPAPRALACPAAR